MLNKEKLRDFFIPHAGNSYRPKSVHPGRIVFYAFTMVLIKILVVGFLFYYPIEAWLTPDIEWQEAGDLIKITNSVRQSSSRPALRESQLLDRAAAFKAQDMLINDYFDHRSPSGLVLADWLGFAKYEFSVAGENLAMGYSDAAGTINAWQESKTHNANLLDPDYSEIGVGMATGILDGERTTIVVEIFATPIQKASEKKISNGLVKTSVRVADGASQNKEVAKKQAEEKKQNDTVSTPEELSTSQISAPVLIEPKDQTIAGAGFDWQIYAPAAEAVEIFIDGELAAQAIPDENGIAKGFLEMPEGYHELLLASKIGENKIFSKAYNLTILKEVPQFDDSRSGLLVNTQAENNIKLVSAEIFLSADTAKAELEYEGNLIPLIPDRSDSRKWVGAVAIARGDEESAGSSPLLPATLVATGKTGLAAAYDVFAKNEDAVSGTFIGQYEDLKSDQPFEVGQIMDITSGLYKIFLILAIIVISLNIFIEIKKQHLHLVFSSLGLVGLLLLLIWI